jgi:Zn-dependent metalloprotease
MARCSILVVVLGLVSQSALLAQQDLASGEVWHIRAITDDSIRDWDANIHGMVQARDLAIAGTLDDPVRQDRRHETLIQYYQGVRVYGGSLARQTASGATVSIFGTLLTGIALDPVPGLSIDQALTVMRNVSGGTPLDTDIPELIIFRTLSETYALSYRAMMSDGNTYYVDASSGEVLQTVDEVKTQSAVGVGTGAVGDGKKIATTQTAGTFRSHDQLRPAPVLTYDTRGSEIAFQRLDGSGSAVDSDFPTDSDNTWTNPAVVDAHVHTGWTQDYLYKQQGWKGVDNRNGLAMNIVHSGFKMNAHFRRLWSDGRGVFAYGVTNTGVPITSLDVVAHEVMHGVTSAALYQRTGSGLGFQLQYHPPRWQSATYEGDSYPCENTTFGGRPASCDSFGRYRTVSNHPGAINEAFADVIGTATELYFHAKGPGPSLLQGDYKNGEDIVGFGPVRTLDIPRSMNIASGVPFPDHFTRTASFIVVETGDGRLSIVPWAIFDGRLTQNGFDGGGVHQNATVLGHAFYLAIEGGQNHSSGFTVKGVGFGNRLQIERAFFRAMTVLMPNEPTMQVAASATIQAAVDLFGANSTAAQAIREAMHAVGLR